MEVCSEYGNTVKTAEIIKIDIAYAATSMCQRAA